MREIIFDTETTGLDPKSGDRLVEIGCIEMVNRVTTGHTFHAYFNPDRDMPAAAEAVHGLSITFLSDKPRFHEKAADFLEFIGDECKLVAHNAGFDFGFVNSELEICGLPPLSRERMIDTVAMARMRHPGAKNSLDALCTRYGIDRSHRTRHGALLDAELLAQVYVELTGGRQIGLSLAAETNVIEITNLARPRQTHP
ncbi:MAG: DNA polymerase III subunit epsilon, partial [Novosphingobium sp.]